MPVQTPFASVQEADAAYYDTAGQDGGDGGDGGGSGGRTWGKLQSGAALGAGWTLAYQTQQNGGRERWFAIRSTDAGLQALTSQGTVYEASETDLLRDLPHYSTESDARAAYQAWADGQDTRPGEDGPGEESAWGEWSKVTTQDPWHIYTRAHSTEDRQQFLAAGVNTSDETVYLAPEGRVNTSVHIFDSSSALTAALEAYAERAANGNVPEDKMPTGTPPSTKVVREQATTTTTTSKTSRLVEKLGGEKVLLAAVVVVGVVAYQSQAPGGILDGGT